MADLQRSIPSMVDGLKPNQRKILFCAFKWPIIEEIEVSRFSGYVTEHSAYHHGEASRFSTIIGMAQDYVGSNNINLLQPRGQFGSRFMGGKDHASGRQLYTQLSPITRYLFHKADELVLNYLYDDYGRSIEPEWFIPIIPMVLVNGSKGTGTGRSSFIPSYNPRDIITNLKRLLNGEAMVPMHPWYKGFKGNIKKKTTSKDSGYTTIGVMDEREDRNILRITELPLRRWTQQYEKFLEAAEDGKDIWYYYTTQYRDETVHFEITMTEDQMNRARQEGFLKKFKLTTTLSTTNMRLFDANGVIKKYDTPEQILEDFFHLRLDFYEKRRKALLRELEKAIKLLKNKERYICLVCDEKIDMFKIKPVDMLDELEKNGLEKVEEGYDYLLSMSFMSFTKEKIKELKQEMAGKEKELDALNEADPKSLWQADLVALDEQLRLDGNYPSAKSPPEIAEEASRKKAPAKRAAASPLPQRANKKR
ncbi:DNA topoisomerase 2 isoform X2 [Tanacetum coccineum]|uniref:DNA topoisomerase (ATP-hydrolyzing) n=1 Tax=Tanacetum coccineum TaxID=301880 RepID=A0ABQ5I3D7_9ASTR